jgi:hypothetical protein
MGRAAAETPPQSHERRGCRSADAVSPVEPAGELFVAAGEIERQPVRLSVPSSPYTVRQQERRGSEELVAALAVEHDLGTVGARASEEAGLEEQVGRGGGNAPLPDVLGRRPQHAVRGVRLRRRRNAECRRGELDQPRFVRVRVAGEDRGVRPEGSRVLTRRGGDRAGVQPAA